MKPSGDGPGRHDEQWASLQERVAHANLAVASRPGRVEASLTPLQRRPPPVDEQSQLASDDNRSTATPPGASTDAPREPAPTGSSIAPVALEPPVRAARLEVPAAQADSRGLRLLVATTGFALLTGLALFAAYRSYEPTRTAPAALAGYGAKLAAVTRVPFGPTGGAAEVAAHGADLGATGASDGPATARIVVPVTTISAAVTYPERARASGSGAGAAAVGGAGEASSTSVADRGARVQGATGAAGQPPPKGEQALRHSLTAAMDSSDWPGVEPGSAVPGSTAFEYLEAPSKEPVSTEQQIPPTRLVPDRRYPRERLRVR